jgi:hypothetical protein
MIVQNLLRRHAMCEHDCPPALRGKGGKTPFGVQRQPYREKANSALCMQDQVIARVAGSDADDDGGSTAADTGSSALGRAPVLVGLWGGTKGRSRMVGLTHFSPATF